jgi:hypothetical protein
VFAPYEPPGALAYTPVLAPVLAPVNRDRTPDA